LGRVSTGSNVLDLVLDGGFLAGGLVAITGPPGSGKTIFAANWIHNGVTKLGEKGLYVSFVEGYDSFSEYMHSLGLDFEKLESEGKFKFLEMITLREAGVQAILEQILHEIMDMNATMLVIDSFSAISQVIEKPYDTRILAHMVLSKIVRRLGCTTMILIEKMSGEEFYEPVEFLSDFIIHFDKTEVDGALLRHLRILKARGTEIRQPHLAFTLKGGFKAFCPLILGGLREPEKRFRLVQHYGDFYSSGIKDLDDFMGMMFRRGCYNLLEVKGDVTLPPERILRATISNVLNQGGYVVIFPPQGLSALTVRKSLEPFVYENFLDHNLKIVDFRAATVEKVEPYVILLDGRSIKEDMIHFWNAVSEFRKKSDRPIFTLVGFDTLEYVYGENEVLKILGEDLAKTRNLGDVRLNIVRPECAVADHLRSLANAHIVVRELCGAVFLQGIKPKTPLLNIEVHTNGESEVKLTPVL